MDPLATRTDSIATRADNPLEIGRPARAPTSEQEVPVQFLGRGSEYFSIWIVNMALSIVTLGIFSAWAKVRSRRYFYGNTRIDGNSFEYHATPMQILKGRLLVGALLIGMGVTAQFVPVAYGVLALIVAALTPWIIVKALAFNARQSSYRNVRFSFRSSVGESYLIFMWLPVLSVLSLGVLVPYMERRSRSFLFSGHSYGNQRCSDTLSTASVFRTYLEAGLWGLLIAGPVLALLFALGIGSAILQPENTDDAAMRRAAVMISTVYGLMFIGGILLKSVLDARIGNLLFNGGSIGDIVAFRSTQRPWTLIRLRLGYTLLTLGSLGFAYPWMRVALARYRAETLVLRVRGSVDDVLGEAGAPDSALADQLAEGLDFDVDLGF